MQSINYPTVPRGEERLRITPTPGHTEEFRKELVAALDAVWNKLNIRRVSDWEAVGGFIGVGVKDADPVLPMWNDAQLGVVDESASPTQAQAIEQLKQEKQTVDQFMSQRVMPLAAAAA